MQKNKLTQKKDEYSFVHATVHLLSFHLSLCSFVYVLHVVASVSLSVLLDFMLCSTQSKEMWPCRVEGMHYTEVLILFPNIMHVQNMQDITFLSLFSAIFLQWSKCLCVFIPSLNCFCTLYRSINPYSKWSFAETVCPLVKLCKWVCDGCWYTCCMLVKCVRVPWIEWIGFRKWDQKSNIRWETINGWEWKTKIYSWRWKDQFWNYHRHKCTN